MSQRVIGARAPVRIDFGGGWTDVPPYCDREGGYVCNVAIARTSRVTLHHAVPDDDVDSSRDADRRLADAALRAAGVRDHRATIENDFPVGAGLGGSSAAGVAMQAAIAGLRDESPTRAELAERSRAVEVDALGIAGGRQDHYAAAFGGALGLTFGDGDDVTVERIPLDAQFGASLAARLVLVYTGESRISAETITAVLDAYRGGVHRVLDALATMKRLAREMRDALVARDVDSLGTLVGEHWIAQRSLHPRIPTARIDAIIEAGARAGSLGAKAMGASGGGCVLLVACEGERDAIVRAVSSLGEVLPVTIDVEGVATCP